MKRPAVNSNDILDFLRPKSGLGNRTDFSDHCPVKELQVYRIVQCMAARFPILVSCHRQAADLCTAGPVGIR